jgi:hypothetical protein
MSKGVSKQCSILNYLRKTDTDLYELLQDLCIGKMLIPRKGSPGITFLRPDKALLNEIKSMATGDEPEAAIEALQSLVLLDSLSNVKEFDDKKSDIPTYLRKKLPVVSVDGKKIVLKNGAEIVSDKDFQARSDRGNINVYVISKALVPTDGPDADFSNAKAKAKKGGADLREGNRIELFEKVVKEFCDQKDNDRDPAMELLVALRGWATKKGNQQVVDNIEAKVSGDSLASLAILLQPYKGGDPDYITNEELAAFVTDSYGSDTVNDSQTFKSLLVYTMNKNAKTDYEHMCRSDKFTEVASNVREEATKCATKCAKLNIVKLLSDFYRDSMPAIAAKLKCKLPARSTVFAEAELRVLSAMVLENSEHRYDADELLTIYRNCKLDKPYMCDDTELIKGSNLGFYYSTVYLIARSDALFYVPSVEGANTDAVADDTAFINLNISILDRLISKREGSANMLSGLTAREW